MKTSHKLKHFGPFWGVIGPFLWYGSRSGSDFWVQRLDPWNFEPFYDRNSTGKLPASDIFNIRLFDISYPYEHFLRYKKNVISRWGDKKNGLLRYLKPLSICSHIYFLLAKEVGSARVLILKCQAVVQIFSWMSSYSSKVMDFTINYS